MYRARPRLFRRNEPLSGPPFLPAGTGSRGDGVGAPLSAKIIQQNDKPRAEIVIDVDSRTLEAPGLGQCRPHRVASYLDRNPMY